MCHIWRQSVWFTPMATNEVVTEPVWWWPLSFSLQQLIFVPSAFDPGPLGAKQYKQMDQVMAKWQDKVWKWHCNHTHTHTGGVGGDLILSLLLAPRALLTKQAHSAHFTVYPLIPLGGSITCQLWPTAYTRDCVHHLAYSECVSVCIAVWEMLILLSHLGKRLIVQQLFSESDLWGMSWCLI